ncbi:MAG: hypothetical protein JW976_04365 [Syntrophaceae bacterium]|nr:hypothetical protein [Syntrophaceae bacterium]
MGESKRMLQLLSCVLILFVVFGCTNERETELRRGVGFMKSLTSSNPADQLAAAHYQANTPEGMIMLYHASLPADGSYPAAYSDRQSLQQWSILVLSGNKENSLIIEGYGEDLAKPIIVEEITFKKRE